MRLKKFAKIYNNSSVSICGKKGRGKDMLTANIIARRDRKHKYYVSNVDYKLKRKVWIKFNPKILRVDNTFKNFIENDVKPYYYPYPDFTDFYLSDCGLYFPSQYNGELNKDYKDIPTFMALSRQLGECYVHTNTQSLNRVWDKIREQSDVYVNCLWCKVFGKIVIQKVRIYEKYESCRDNVPPCRVRVPLKAEARTQALIHREKYKSTYGDIKTRYLIYVNKSKYDTRLFKTILETEAKNVY